MKLAVLPTGNSKFLACYQFSFYAVTQFFIYLHFLLLHPGRYSCDYFKHKLCQNSIFFALRRWIFEGSILVLFNIK